MAAGDAGVCMLGFDLNRRAMKDSLEKRFGPIDVEVRRSLRGITVALEDYLAGNLDALDGVPTDPGGTSFQREVWKELRKIPASCTVSYRELAEAVGNPAAVRAVGMANARNPIAIVIPCHRVIRSDGSLCGYAGGVHRKRWLLSHEGGVF